MTTETSTDAQRATPAQAEEYFLTAVKPLGRRAYTSIPHLPGSHRSVGDYLIEAGQARILTEKRRDDNDWILVQEKVDGTNVAVARIDGQIVPLIRAGYRVEDSRYSVHKRFGPWVYERQQVFLDSLRDGERWCGEWLAQTHSVRYDLKHRPPFIIFDLMTEDRRATLDELHTRFATHASLSREVTYVTTFHGGMPITPQAAIEKLGMGFYGALDQPEGVVYRCERNDRVEFVAKYVRPEFKPGIYLEGEPVWQWPIDDPA